jgi:hypothetical protein
MWWKEISAVFVGLSLLMLAIGSFAVRGCEQVQLTKRAAIEKGVTQYTHATNF